MKNLFLTLLATTLSMIVSAQSINTNALSTYDKNAPVGWATVNGSITGSNDENPITVETKDALVSALSGTAKKTIYVKGEIQFTGLVSINGAQNKTVYGLPGAILSNPTHTSSKDQTGILQLKNCKNIILRNLTFKGAGAYDIDGSDNLEIQSSTYIWVDHCDFQDGVDGNLDCNNGSDNICVSWCRFRYLIAPWSGGSGGSNDHRFTNLWGGGDNNESTDGGKLRTTFVNCWWDEGCKERMPRIRFGQVHLLNCLYSSSIANYCVGGGYRSNAYIEKCAFTSTKAKNTPWKNYATSSGKTDYNVTIINCSGAADKQERSGSIDYFIPSEKYSYESYDANQVESVVSNTENGAGATLKFKENNIHLIWDYTEAPPSNNPDNGLYYGATVNDSGNNQLKGIKLNGSGYAYFAKPAVAGKLSLTIGPRSGNNDFNVDVFACTIANGSATKGKLIATSEKVAESNTVHIDIPADVTGIYIQRNVSVEGVLSKIVFKESVPRNFVDFEINLVSLPTEFDTSTLPSGVSFSGTYNSDTHGYRNANITVPVDGTVKFTIGGCQYANKTFTVTNSTGKVIATLDPKTENCYHQDKSTITYLYVGDADVLKFNDIQYLPYFKAEATDITEETITYKDQNGKILGKKTVNHGDAIGEVPYTEADLTIENGYKFRGWVYTNGVKVKATDIADGSKTIRASVTEIEKTPEIGSIQHYDLTSNIFYPEDHENFNVANGSYYNNHGFNFNANGSFSVKVGGKAQIELTLCKEGNGTTITVTDEAGRTISSDVPAKATKDGATTFVKYDGEATTLTFTFAEQSYLHKVTVYNVKDFIEKDETSGYYIVPAGDGASLVMAIKAAKATANTKIFLPNGTYDLEASVKTEISGTNVSIIGQDMEKVIIKNAPPISMEGLGKADLFLNTGSGLYIQDLTLQNALDYYNSGSAGRAPTLHDQGTQTINKNVRHLSHQDTYYSHKTGGLYYFEGGELHGTVDYLCGNGKVYYNEVKLVNEERSSATITANSELYVFNNCTIENHAGSYNFGRAWSDNPTCIYLNTILEDPSKLIETRWNLEGINCDYKIAGEYGTKDKDGNNITPTSNTITFKKANTTLNTILAESELSKYTIDKVLGTWAATAQQQTKQLSAPTATYDNGTVTWSAVDGASAYALFKNGEFLGITTSNSYNVTVDATKDALTIRTANSRGGFGAEAAVAGTVSGINAISNDRTDNKAIYTLQGVRVEKPTKGIYIIGGRKVVFK